MKQLLNKIRTCTLTALAALSLCAPTANAAIMRIDNGILMGIDDIDIGGVFYDVDFGDGVWHDIDGDFATATSATNGLTHATDFLLTEAQLEVGLTEIKSLLDGSAFENEPTAINGCTTTPSICNVHTPFGTETTDSGGHRYDTMRFRIISAADNEISNSGFRFDGSAGLAATYAVWSTSASTSAVPEPSSYAILLSGGLVMFAFRKRKIS